LRHLRHRAPPPRPPPPHRSSSTAAILSYRHPIAINYTKVANSDQSNFPVLTSGAGSDHATVANGVSPCSAASATPRGRDVLLMVDASNPLNPVPAACPAWICPNGFNRLPAIVFQTQIPVDYYDKKVL